ncbi:MAG: GNAT family N-acetyltransferase [Clostridiaceae bacterium]|nr:GNAT family N-acetyltransferase [Eubacteriales bacterium]
MESIRLVRPAPEHERAVMEYREEFLRDGDSLDGTAGLRHAESYRAWMEKARRNEFSETLDEGLVEATTFLAIRESDGALVGFIDVRHRLNEYLAKFGGHIGYSVRACERKKGYAKEMLFQALAYCKTLGLKRALVTCNDDNEASRRTILAHGGVMENTMTEDNGQVVERYWIEL